MADDTQRQKPARQRSERQRAMSDDRHYHDVALRILQLRRDYPAAEISTDHVQIDDKIAIFKATVTIPNGAKASGYGTETTAAFVDYIERAETKAIGRALTALGYAADLIEQESADQSDTFSHHGLPQTMTESTEAGDPVRIADSRSVRSLTPFDSAESSQTVRPIADADTAHHGQEIDDVKQTVRTVDSVPLPPPRVIRSPTVLEADQDPPLEDYSWTAFWRWARPLGFENRGAIEALIGMPIASMNPAQVRDLIKHQRGDS